MKMETPRKPCFRAVFLTFGVALIGLLCLLYCLTSFVTEQHCLAS